MTRSSNGGQIRWTNLKGSAQGQTGTVINTRTKPDLISHDVALDFDETITAPRDQLELIPDDYAKIIWSDVDGVTVDFGGGSASNPG